MIKSKSFHPAAGAMISLMCNTMAAHPAPPSEEALPPHYHEVAAIVGGASGEPIDPGCFAAREKARQLGDEDLPALVRLFEQTQSDSLRATVAGVMLYSKIDKKKAVDFLLPQIPKEMKDWQGKESWIGACAMGICDADPQQGLPLARKALASTHERLQFMSILALGKTGGEPEIKLLNEEWDRHGRGAPQAGDNLPGKLRLAIEQISKRLEAGQSR